jgi:hypothetical protein
LVADDAVFASGFSGGQGVLGVDYFEHGGLTGGVAKANEAEAFAGGGGAVIERGDLVAGDGGFAVSFVNLGDEMALGRGERDFGRFAEAYFLADAILG